VNVIGVGFGRTGTMSIKVALEELGAEPCLHSLDSLEMLDTWPEAKVILSVEDLNRQRSELASRVPADRLLVYDVHDGWAPLCAFLDVPVPETPFPHLNGREPFRARSVAAERTPRSADHVPRITGLTVLEPETSLSQDEVLKLLRLTEDEFAQRIFGRSGVRRRRLDLLRDFAETPLQGRTEAVDRKLLEYAVDAVERLAVDASEIGTVVTSSLFSLTCPTLAQMLIERFEMESTTDKYDVIGVGCASAVPLIRLAAQSLGNHPDRKALIVAAESMSGLLSAASADDPRSKTVGSAIFGDGCGAILIDRSPSAEGPAVVATRVHHIPNTLGAVSMKLSPTDSYLHMVKELPDVAGSSLRPLVDEFLSDNGITGHMVDHWLIHPGGRRIIEAAQQALSLSDDDVRVSYEVLANNGNVGTPTIFYVMRETIEHSRPSPGERGLVVTIGPGVSIGLMLLRW
jgi:alkylresorcinol/alkylpyrone synthase